ncbi:MAG: hypothetical protein M1837_002168 [Sclerophora amabilis]|nr:MAG: hypothetical protein M1837_002168 [Sclerophora amabilis]
MEVGDFSVKDKIIVVTGGGSGINLAFTRLAASHGAKIVIADLRLTQEAEEFKADRKNVVFEPCDVTKWADLENLITVSEKTFGDVPDCYIAGAGIFDPPWSSFWDDTAVDRYAEVEVNVNHPIKLTQIAIRTCQKKGKQGVVAILASVGGYLATFPTPVYCATKHAMVGFTRSLAEANAAAGVKVACICPGVVFTPLFTTYPDKVEQYSIREETALSPDDVASCLLSLVEDGQYGGGTVLEITRRGTRVVPAVDLGPRMEIPKEVREKMHAPVIRKLKEQRRKSVT